MINNEVGLAYFLIAILTAFAVLIYVLLKVRVKLQSQDLQINSATVWELIAEHAANLKLQKSNLLFGVYQDVSSNEISITVKNNDNQLVGNVFCKTLTRIRKISIGDNNYIIEYPLTWKRTALLREVNENKIIARYAKTNWLGQHEFEVEGYGLIQSHRPSFDLKVLYDYKLGDETIGSSRKISFSRDIGRLVVLPTDLPLVVRVFILAV